MSSRLASHLEGHRMRPIQWTALPVRVPEPDPVEVSEPFAAAPFVEAPVADGAPAHDLSHEIEKAYQRGLAEGKNAAAAEAKRNVGAFEKRLSDAALAWAGTRARFRLEAEADVVKLSLAIAKRILRREISVDPSSIQALVRIALEKFEIRELASVKVNTCHVTAVQAEVDRLQREKMISVVADPSLQPGDLIVEANGEQVDASIESQLKEIELGFADRLGK